MSARCWCLPVALCGLMCAKVAHADLLIYKVPGLTGARPGAPGGAPALDPALLSNLPGGFSLENLPAGLLPPGVTDALTKTQGAPQTGVKPVETRMTYQGRFQVNGKQVTYTHPGQRELELKDAANAGDGHQLGCR